MGVTSYHIIEKEGEREKLTHTNSRAHACKVSDLPSSFLHLPSHGVVIVSFMYVHTHSVVMKITDDDANDDRSE